VAGLAGEFGAQHIKSATDERTTAVLNDKAGEANERANILAIDLEKKARAETARADANLLSEQRLTARERWRLERLESIVLPRSIKDPNDLVAALKAAAFHP
jgi:hypothetical protein